MDKNTQTIEGTIPYKIVVKNVDAQKDELEILKQQNEILTKKLEAAQNYIKSMFI